MFNHWEQDTLNCHRATPVGRGMLHVWCHIHQARYIWTSSLKGQDKGILTNRVAVISSSKTLQKQWNTHVHVYMQPNILIYGLEIKLTNTVW